MKFALAILVAASTAHFALGQVYRFEAESGALGGSFFANSTPGYSGTGYVSFNNETAQYVQVSASVPIGLYEMWVGYNSPFGFKGYEYQVNGVTGGGGFDGNGNQWGADRAGVFDLSQSTNTLRINRGWGWYNVDYLELRPFTPPELLPVSAQLADPAASQGTQMLMNFLVSQYGHKTLSGLQHNSSDNLSFPVASYLSQSGGIVPAIRGSDLIDYSPSRIAYGENPRNETEQTIAWAKQTGGMVTVMWHWNAPANLINQPGKEWWRGFYSDATTFDLPGALANPSGSDYQLLLRDIDAIAAELQKYQDAGVPVIWRPLHEAQGTWFWWGDHGPDAFKQLWNLMYDRLTNYHGLHNLIWEFTSSAAEADHIDWYPGDDVVDIVGLDIYTDPAATMNGPWYDILEYYNGRKMIALSETDTLVGPDVMELWDTAWSYVAPWTWDFVRSEYANAGYSMSQLSAILQDFLNDENVITLSELPLLPWNNAAPIAGDYNRDGTVDAADYIVWRSTTGQTGGGLAADGDFNGQVDKADYFLWLSNFGTAATATSTALAGAATPEPSPTMLLLTALPSLGLVARKAAKAQRGRTKSLLRLDARA